MGMSQNQHHIPRGGKQNFVVRGVERVQPILDNQPLLPETRVVRFLQLKDTLHDGILVYIIFFMMKYVKPLYEACQV